MAFFPEVLWAQQNRNNAQTILLRLPRVMQRLFESLFFFQKKIMSPRKN